MVSKFCGNFLKVFRVDLKAWLPAPLLPGIIEDGFQVTLLHGPCLLFVRPYYEPLLWFMIWYMQTHVTPNPLKVSKSTFFTIA